MNTASNITHHPADRPDASAVLRVLLVGYGWGLHDACSFTGFGPTLAHQMDYRKTSLAVPGLKVDSPPWLGAYAETVPSPSAAHLGIAFLVGCPRV